MSRKIIVNIIIAFILFPLLLLLREPLTQSVEWNKIGDISMVQPFLHDIGYPYISIAFLLIILLPFQLIKNYFYKRGKPLNLLTKLVIFTALFLLVIFTLWGGDVVSIIWIYYLFISVIITVLSQIFVDRHVQRIG